MNLDQLAIKYGSDKSSLRHDYMIEYEMFFKPFQESTRAVLELGVWKGASLRIWERYFPSARIYGIDIIPVCKCFGGGKSEVFIGNQQDVKFMKRVCNKTGPLDIIIDDCGHVLEHQIISLWFLYYKLKQGGIYVIEDLEDKALNELLINAKKIGAQVLSTYKGKVNNEMLLILKRK